MINHVKKSSHEYAALKTEALTSLTALGQTIALARKARGLSQRAFAANLGISPQTMLFIEQGRPNVQIGHYARALSLLNAPMLAADDLSHSDSNEIEAKIQPHQRMSQERIRRAVRRHLTLARQEPAAYSAHLEFAYDWSNQQMSDDVLIHKVVDKGRFRDLAMICKRFGIDQVRRVAKAKLANSPSLRRSLANIAQGFADAQTDSA